MEEEEKYIVVTHGSVKWFFKDEKAYNAYLDWKKNYVEDMRKLEAEWMWGDRLKPVTKQSTLIK